METKHTKGEWIYDIKAWRNSKPSSITIQLKEENHFSGKSIAQIKPICGDDLDRLHYSIEESEANAKLIAAAPDLLEALIMVKNWAEEFGMGEKYYDQVVKAINKATK